MSIKCYNLLQKSVARVVNRSNCTRFTLGLC